MTSCPPFYIYTRLFIIGLLILVHWNLFSQCGGYVDDKYRADSCYKAGDYENAALYYQRCVRSGEKLRRDYYYASYSYLKAGKRKEALNNLSIAAADGLHYFTLDNFYSDTLFRRYYESSPEWKKVGERIKANTISYENQAIIDSALVKVLLMREKKDQLYRKPHYLSSFPKTVSDSLLNIMGEIDLENQKWLADEIKQNGWPTISRAGAEGDNAAWLIVQHADNDTTFQKNCLELLKRLMFRNEINLRNVAYLEDRVRINTNKKQLYGTQFENVLKDGKTIDLKLKPTENLPCLDKRRAVMDLEPVEDYLSFARKRYVNSK